MIFIFTGHAFCDDSWELVPGIKDSNLKEVCVDYENQGVIYASGVKTLYRTGDGGVTWTVVFFSQADEDAINFIGTQGHAIFVCTGNGLFASNDSGINWKRIFKGIGEKENKDGINLKMEKL